MWVNPNHLEEAKIKANRPDAGYWWQFWQIKDARTLFGCCKIDPRKVLKQTNLHNALADAYFQAKGVQLAYKELGVER